MRIAGPTWARSLGDEALRLFFPLAALHAALWPLLWVGVLRLDLPLAQTAPSSLWHAHEMAIGSFGAALLGYVLTAAPEWTGLSRPRGRRLFMLAGLWGVGRFIGLLGADAVGGLGAAVDLIWLGAVVVYLGLASLRGRTSQLRGFLLWAAVLWNCELTIRFGFLTGDALLASRGLRLALLALAALLGLALSRIAPAVINRILDPTLQTTPFRPHPGRRNLAPILIGVVVAAQIVGVSPAVNGFLLIAAGAAFLGKAGEAFVGRAALRSEIMGLTGASAATGAGLILMGLAGMDGRFPELAGVHLLSMGGLGLGVLAVFAVAGRLHTGRALDADSAVGGAFALLSAAAASRTLAAFALPEMDAGVLHLFASATWAGAFLLWLYRFWPWLSEPPRPREESDSTA